MGVPDWVQVKKKYTNTKANIMCISVSTTHQTHTTEGELFFQWEGKIFPSYMKGLYPGPGEQVCFHFVVT